MNVRRLHRHSRWLLALAVVAAGAVISPTVAAADAAPSITSAPTTTFTVGTAATFTVTTAGDLPMTIDDGGAVVPSGLSFTDNGDGTATLEGTPAVGTGGDYPLTITAANGFGPDAVQSFTLTVDEAPAITSATEATFTAGSPGAFTVTTTGSPEPILAESGPLPSGMTFTDNGDGTATLEGTPAGDGGGGYPITVTASNGSPPEATQALTVVVHGPPTLSLLVSAFSTSGPVTYQVEVNGPLGPATGSVAVSDGRGGTCMAALSSGQGDCAINEAAASSPFSVTAMYSGDGNYTATQTTSPVVAGVAVAGSASTETNQITATAVNGQDGVDTVTEVSYPANPVTPLAGGETFFDVAVSTRAQFSSLLITDCDAVNASTLLEWWNPATAAWQPVAGDPGPQLDSKSDGCLSVALDGTNTSPTLAQLSGSVLATATYGNPTKPRFVGKASATCYVDTNCLITLKTSGAPAPSISEVGTLPFGMEFIDVGRGQAVLITTPEPESPATYVLTLTAANGAGTLRRRFALLVKAKKAASK